MSDEYLLGHGSLKTKALLLILIITACTLTPTGQDKYSYRSHLYPDDPLWSTDWVAFYEQADALTALTRSEFPHHLDIPYGDDPKQKLDLYLSEETPQGAPVFIFLHGGGFREGDRAHFGFVAKPFLNHGILTVVASYRLLSQGFHYPSQSEDVQKMLAWVYRYIEDYGGDRNRIYIGGHSAGAYLAADVSVQREWLRKQSLPRDLIKGFAPISGIYDMRHFSRWYYVPDPDLRSQASPLLHVSKLCPPAVVAVGTLEPSYIPEVNEFAKRIREQGGQAEFLVLPAMQHHDTVLALSNEGGKLFQAILRMVESSIAPEANDPRLLGSWRIVSYHFSGDDYPGDGLVILTPKYFSSTGLFRLSGDTIPDVNSNAGPYTANGQELVLTQWIQLHVRPGDETEPIFLRQGVDERIDYRFDGNRLFLNFPSGNHYVLERLPE